MSVQARSEEQLRREGVMFGYFSLTQGCECWTQQRHQEDTIASEKHCSCVVENSFGCCFVSSCFLASAGQQHHDFDSTCVFICYSYTFPCPTPIYSIFRVGSNASRMLNVSITLCNHHSTSNITQYNAQNTTMNKLL